MTIAPPVRIGGMDVNPYEAPAHEQSPPKAKRSVPWNWICLGGFALALTGCVIMPLTLSPHPIAFAVALGGIASMMIGSVAFVVGAIGCFVGWLNSSGG